ncbi:hypothetical protein J4414_00525 [Candidatus Woesearchaeota archaeon]|nr:hypothetical protein [Candidatus Woesearchaeota archaeon]
MKRGLLILFLIGLVFVLGCKQAEVEVPKPEPVPEVIEETPEPVAEEPSPLDVISEITGKECTSLADCGENIDVDDPYCLAGGLYQKFYKPKCSFKKSGESGLECSYENATKRIDSC